jgi:hypothetical protein
VGECCRLYGLCDFCGLGLFFGCFLRAREDHSLTVTTDEFTYTKNKKRLLKMFCMFILFYSRKFILMIITILNDDVSIGLFLVYYRFFKYQIVVLDRRNKVFF